MVMVSPAVRLTGASSDQLQTADHPGRSRGCRGSATEDDRPPPCPAALEERRAALSQRANILGLRPLGPLGDVELHPLVLLEGAVTRGHDRREVRKHVLAAVILGDEAESLVPVEPFDGTGGHDFLLADSEVRT